MCNLDLQGLLVDKKLDLLEVCCSSFEGPYSKPWDGYVDDETELVKLCIKLSLKILHSTEEVNFLLAKGIRRRPETHQTTWIREEYVERKRLVLAFLAEKFADKNDNISEERLTSILNTWGELHMWEKYQYAEAALTEEGYQKYVKEGDDHHEFTKKLYAKICMPSSIC